MLTKNLALDVKTLREKVIFPDPNADSLDDGWVTMSGTKISLDFPEGSLFVFIFIES